MNSGVLTKSDFEDIRLVKRGKVRDVYQVEDKLLIVASDRMSAFDVIMDDPIPDKGKILTAISLFWFSELESVIENHLISSTPSEYPEVCQKYAPQLEGRSMLVKKTEIFPDDEMHPIGKMFTFMLPFDVYVWLSMVIAAFMVRKGSLHRVGFLGFLTDLCRILWVPFIFRRFLRFSAGIQH